MAIQRCGRCEMNVDLDWFPLECPKCSKPWEHVEASATRIEITDKAQSIIKRLMDGYPFQAKDRELHDECKRVLGEA